MKTLILLLLFCSNLMAANSLLKTEKIAIDYYISGDYSKYLSKIDYLIKKGPTSPDSLFYLLTLHPDKSLFNDYYKIIPQYIKTIRNDNIDYFTKHVILSELIKYYNNRADHASANKYVYASCTLNDWSTTGPFNNTFYNDIHNNFKNIETDINLALTDLDLKWTLLPYKTTSDHYPLNILASSDAGTYYSSSYFYLPKTMTIILWISSEASVKTFIDNQLIFVNDERDYSFSKNNIYQITLTNGWHNILIKSLSGNNRYDFKCKIMDKKGYLIKGFKTSVAVHEIQRVKIKSRRVNPEIYKYYETKVKGNTKQILDYYKYCMIDYFFLNENRALKHLERYIHQKITNPLLNFLAGRIYMLKYTKLRKHDYLEKAKFYFNKVIDTAPNFLKAKQYLVNYQQIKQNPDKVHHTLKEIQKKSYFLWGDYYNLIKWNYLKYKSYYHESKQNPQKSYYQHLLALFYQNHSIQAALPHFLHLEDSSFLNFNKSYLLDIYLKQNDTLKLNNLLNKIYMNNKYDLNYYLYKSLQERNNGNFTKSVEILQQYLSIKPSYIIENELGNLYEHIGSKQSALKYYKSAFEKRPYSLNLYKKISFFKNNKIFHSLEDEYLDLDTSEIITRAFQENNSNESLIKMYLDLLIIKPFKKEGYTYLIHEIYKILDDNGKEKFGEVKIPANNSHIIRVCNHLSKDKTIDAVDYKEHNGTYYISIPNLKIGSVVEVCYQIFYPYNWMDKTKYFYFSPFFFQDGDYNMAKSTFILVEKKDALPVKYMIRNDNGINYITEQKNDETIHIWEKTNSIKFQKEYNSVPIYDLVPHIYYSSISNWNIFSRWYYGKIKKLLKINYDVEQKIFEIFERSKERTKFNIFLYLKNCYDYIQKNIDPTYDYLFYPEPIEIIYSRQKGNTEEKTLLMYTFLEKINIDCELVLVRNKQFSDFNFSIVYPEAFNSLLLRIPKQKNLQKELYLDFSNKYIPFGIIQNKFIKTTGLCINEQSSDFIETPDFANTDIVIENFSTIISTNEFLIKGKILYSGQFNINKENYADDIKQESEIFEYINSMINRISILNYSLSNLNSHDKNLKIIFTGALLPEKKTEIIFDKLELSKRYVSKSMRTTPLKIYNPLFKDITNEVRINEKYRLDIENIDIQNEFGEYKLKIDKHDGFFIIKRHVRIEPQVINTTNYSSFLSFCRKIDNIESEKLELFR